MKTTKIELLKYRGQNSTLFTGRPQGEMARNELKLDEMDKEDGTINLVIPKGTTSFNPSFFLGLLYDSIKRLGLNNFTTKYIFIIEDDDEEIKKVINDNIEDGKRNALNSIDKKNIFDKFFFFA